MDAAATVDWCSLVADSGTRFADVSNHSIMHTKWYTLPQHKLTIPGEVSKQMQQFSRFLFSMKVFI
jgi:hypothetical protein